MGRAAPHWVAQGLLGLPMDLKIIIMFQASVIFNHFHSTTYNLVSITKVSKHPTQLKFQCYSIVSFDPNAQLVLE